MNKLIEMGKQYKTRDGLPVRVLCTDNTNTGIWSVVATVDGTPSLFTKEGWFCVDEEGNNSKHDWDLIEQPQEITVWIEVFKSDGYILSCSHEAEEALWKSIADSKASSSKSDYTLIATKKVIIKEGETV